MNGTWGHYTKWIKSEKRQIAYDLICGKRKQKTKPKDTKNRLVLDKEVVSVVDPKWVKQGQSLQISTCQSVMGYNIQFGDYN